MSLRCVHRLRTPSTCEQAVAAERVRIARDMHDVVAHSLTLLVIHAETVRARSGELPPWARERIDALATAGRQATGEMRELLQVLRDGTPTAVPRALLLDVRMPGHDGLWVLERLTRRGLLGRRTTRVLMLATFDLDECIDEALSRSAPPGSSS